jgi:transcription antitermination protein NusB
MVIKTIKQMEEDRNWSFLPLYKPNDDEQEFIRDLLRKTISMNSENEKA